jgi:hypothetical protein
MIDIIGSVLVPHLVALAVLFRIAMWEVRPGERISFRREIARLWVWVRPHWRSMVAHPLYWAATGIVTAYFLVEPIRRLFA